LPSSYDTTSTKTRIETVKEVKINTHRVVVMTPLPPKQGLKRNQNQISAFRTFRYDTTSTKTRIETVLGAAEYHANNPL